MTANCSEEMVAKFLRQNVSLEEFHQHSVLVVIPQSAFTAELPVIFAQLFEYLRPSVAILDVLMATGDDSPLSEAQIAERLGIHETERQRLFFQTRFFNHDWDRSEQLHEFGVLSAEFVADLTENSLTTPLPIRLNSRLQSYDRILILDNVHPQAVFGFTGGWATLIHGLGGVELLSRFAQLSLTSAGENTAASVEAPGRKLVDAAAAVFMTDDRAGQVSELAFVRGCPEGKGQGLQLFYGSPFQVWSAAAALSHQWHIVDVKGTVDRIIWQPSKLSRDLWSLAEEASLLLGMLKEGGELFIDAAEITELSASYRAICEWERITISDPQLASSSQRLLKSWLSRKLASLGFGLGHFSESHNSDHQDQRDLDQPRYQLSLATGIRKKTCVDLGAHSISPAQRERLWQQPDFTAAAVRIQGNVCCFYRRLSENRNAENAEKTK